MLKNTKTYFPIFKKYPDLVYLDSAATTQRPKLVIDAINQFNSFENANIHRGVYDLSNSATKNFELAREKVAKYLGSTNPKTIAFTSGTTNSINIVASSFLRPRLNKDDNVVITLLDHHANFIPWQMLAKEKEAEFRVVPIDKNGNLDLTVLEKSLDQKTKFLSLNHISNSLGTTTDIGEIIALAHKKNIPVMIDAAQSIAYYDLDIHQLDYDFLAFSGHKMFGPFGIGVLYVAEKWMKNITPYNYGGGIIKDVTIEDTTFSDFPFNIEAGTPNISGVMGLSSAIDFIHKFDKKEMIQHISDLVNYCTDQLISIDKVKIIGNPENRSGIISFVVDGIHPHDVASFLNQDNIAVRAGMHCTQPLLAAMNTSATVRVSFSIYNERKEVDQLKNSLVELIKFWS
ncbi:MAG: cysteine desulfurase [Cyclobacteriaceae bacterium]|nr:cysteine desulfurase [Cyclobacteriaceae bacterium]